MRHIDNWDSIQEKQPGDFNNPVPGGYSAVITRVDDREDKEYLEIQWDYLDGPFRGANGETLSRAGFWPTILRRSYKETALGFFKAFKNAVEKSNPGYIFDDRHVQSLVGKYMGVVTGLEEYQKNNGEIVERLYVYQVRSTQAIRKGDFEVPNIKKLKAKNQPYNFPQTSYGSIPASNGYGLYTAGNDFADISGDDKDFPF